MVGTTISSNELRKLEELIEEASMKSGKVRIRLLLALSQPQLLGNLRYQDTSTRKK
jgi:hypothetical protein